jgi:hypothetical protein
MNYIVEQMVTRPKELDAIYSSLPESKREAIKHRDGVRSESAEAKSSDVTDVSRPGA